MIDDTPLHGICWTGLTPCFDLSFSFAAPGTWFLPGLSLSRTTQMTHPCTTPPFPPFSHFTSSASPLLPQQHQQLHLPVFVKCGAFSWHQHATGVVGVVVNSLPSHTHHAYEAETLVQTRCYALPFFLLSRRVRDTGIWGSRGVCVTSP